MTDLPKYRIELLTRKIIDHIENTGCDSITEDTWFEFESCTATIKAAVYWIGDFDSIDIESCQLQFEVDLTIFNMQEIVELEELIKLYK
ncbi:hypothetical protein KAR91_25710 [Candidatus Pacearchaeota archaeon]|nr:hypothetical protein [Candidatus Pacearchaeota archaeon]